MGQVILVVSGKGGSGKSTVSVNCGAALAQRGRSVLLVDADAGLRALDLMLNVTDTVVYDLFDVLTGECEPVKAIVKTDVERLFLMPAPQTSFGVPGGDEFGRLCKGLSHYYDYVLVDSPAGLGPTVTAAARGCDRAVVVTNAEPVSVRDADRVAACLPGCGLTDMRMVINRVNPKLIRKKLAMNLDQVIDGAALRLLGVIPDDAAVTRAACSGRLALQYKCPAAQAFRNIAARIDGENVLLMKL